MNDIITSDLARFGSRERSLLVELLTAWNEHGLPSDFYDDEVRPVLNTHSGYVFLTNSDYQVAMVDDSDQLASFYASPWDGHEGFYDDLVDLYDEMCPEDQEWLRDIAANLGRDMPGGES